MQKTAQELFREIDIRLATDEPRIISVLRGIVRACLVTVLLPIGFVLGCCLWCFMQGLRAGAGWRR